MPGTEDESLDRIMDVPERVEKQEEEKRLVFPQRNKPLQKLPETEDLAGKLPLILSALALALSLLALGIAVLYQPYQGISNAELNAIADDLRAMRDAGFEAQDSFGTVYSVNAEIPVSEAIGGKFQVPIEMNLPLSGTVVGTSPWGSTVSIPVSGTIPVKMTANITLGGSSEKIRITAQVPGNVSTSLTVMPSGQWKEKLDDIIERLERMAG